MSHYMTCPLCPFKAMPENSREVGIVVAMLEHRTREHGSMEAREREVFRPISRGNSRTIPARAEPRPCPRCTALMRSDSAWLWCEECAWVEAA